jgi:hypothetical protein
MNNKISGYVIQIFLTIIILITSTFIWIENQDKKIDFITLESEIYIEELSNPITLSNVYPTKDEDGIKEQGYTFQVINNSNKEEITFYLQNTLEEQENSLNYKYIRYQVTKNNKIIVKPTNIKENGILFTDNNTNKSTYEIKMWIDYNSDNNVYGKNFSTKLALL